MKKILTLILFLASLAASSISNAQSLRLLEEGDKAVVRGYYCDTNEELLELLRAWTIGGIPRMKEVYRAIDGCGAAQTEVTVLSIGHPYRREGRTLYPVHVLVMETGDLQWIAIWGHNIKKVERDA